MERTHINGLHDKIGQEVLVKGWVDIRRDHGKLIFIDFRDASGKVQAVALPNHAEAHAVAGELRSEWVVEAKGIVNQRPERMVNADTKNGDIEIELTELTVLSPVAELPFEKDAELNLDTYLNHLPLTLRGEKQRAVFKVQATLLAAFRSFLNENGFVEFQAPKLIGEDAEGGANSFDVPYFGHIAHLAQSPQFYKQIMVGIFERVYSSGIVFRAEKHSTTRHLNEYTSLDIEMGFIESFRDIMALETRLLSHVFGIVAKECADELKLHGVELPQVPSQIPSFKLREAQDIIKKEYGEDCGNEPDLEPQHERWLCEYAKKEFNSDFMFVTHFPLSKRPMYTYEDPADPGYAGGFDLLYRGVEITTGGQRIHVYDDLVAAMKRKGVDPDKFSFYLQAFKYGMPPHGGFGMGLERLTAKILELPNVKEATLFPRDINRIDNLLSK
jgi:nondiscriminating aspartyl-tRNA synthetase